MLRVQTEAGELVPEPYLRMQKKVERRGLKAVKSLFVFVLCLLLVTTTLCTTRAFAAQKGYWKKSDATSTATGSDALKTGYEWYTYDGSQGTKIDSFTYNNQKVTDGIYWTSAGKPTTAPDEYEGYEVISDPTTQQGAQLDTSTNNSELAEKKISENAPEFDLSTEYVGNLLIWLMWKGCSMLTSACCDLGEWLLTITGVGAKTLFSQDYATGNQQTFYAAANKVASYAITPYAIALLVCTFVIWLAHATDQRARQNSQDFGINMLFAVALFAVALTLISHAIELCGAIYWLAQNLVTGVSKGLSAIGLTPGFSELGLKSALIGEINEVTYGNWSAFILIAFGAIVAAISCGNCTMYVLSAAFLRIGKVYLEASLSPLALSTIVDDRSRRIGLNYLRSFGATCFQAVTIFIALALAPLIFTLASALVTPLMSTTSGIAGITSSLEALIPMLVAIESITAIVKASEPVANKLFGAMGDGPM